MKIISYRDSTNNEIFVDAEKFVGAIRPSFNSREPYWTFVFPGLQSKLTTEQAEELLRQLSGNPLLVAGEEAAESKLNPVLGNFDRKNKSS
jgi:hypothetical protein